MEKKNTVILHNPIIAFLKLIRFENLLIIFFTQYLIRYAVLDSLMVFNGYKIPLQLSNINFFLVCLSTILIAAGGNIINDYFDIKIDRINRPDTVVIDKTIKRRVAMMAHWVVNLLGIALGFYTGWKAGNINLGTIHLLGTGLLWFYSTNFKRQLIIGNLVVSFLTAMVPIIVIAYDMPGIVSFTQEIFPNETIYFNNVYKYIFMFALFAFLTSLIREIIKDMEDEKGDAENGCKTMPVTWGQRTTKAITIGIISNTILLLSFIVYKLFSPAELIPTIYILSAIISPLLYLIWMLYKAKAPKDFSRASVLVKFIMLSGVCFSFIIWYLANKTS